MTMQRNWNTTDDYWEIRKNTDEKFNDINFPTDDAIAWKEFGESGALDSKNITWKRISDPTFPAKKFWGDNGVNSISVEDIRQG